MDRPIHFNKDSGEKETPDEECPVAHQEAKGKRKKKDTRADSSDVCEDEGSREDSTDERDDENVGEDSRDSCDEDNVREEVLSEVLISGDGLEDDMDDRWRPRLTTSSSGADIMLGLETDDGKTAEVEIDSLETDELQPEEIPKGRVRKTSIVEKLSKSKESELIALSIMESAGQRQREFEKLISEHQELVQEISRTPSAENIVQSEAGRDP
jgi:hypothetical protein